MNEARALPTEDRGARSAEGRAMTHARDADRLDRALRAAVAEGLLPPGASRPAIDARPWPVVLLVALGAWLAAIPLIILFLFTMRLFVKGLSQGAIKG